jgi:hypothetical protein
MLFFACICGVQQSDKPSEDMEAHSRRHENIGSQADHFGGTCC